MFLFEAIKSSIHREKLPTQGLQCGCLSLPVVGGGSGEDLQLSDEDLDRAVHKNVFKMSLVWNAQLSSFMSADIFTTGV